MTRIEELRYQIGIMNLQLENLQLKANEVARNRDMISAELANLEVDEATTKEQPHPENSNSS